MSHPESIRSLVADAYRYAFPLVIMDAIGVAIGARVLLLADADLDHVVRGGAGRALQKGGGDLLDALGSTLEQQAEAHATLAAMLFAPMEPARRAASCWWGASKRRAAR